jgi:hypothetical protein
MTTSKFQIGKTYEMLFIGDADLRVQFVCVKRTDKTVTLKGTHETLNCRVKEYSGSEYVKAGSYSMAPTIYANKVVG